MLIGTRVTTPGKLISVAVLIGGVPQNLYRRPWDSRIFVTGTPGAAYVLDVLNRTDGRVEVIASVDGRNVLKDERANEHDSRGLVVYPQHQRRDSGPAFPGWRISDDDTREFLFGSPEASVAAQAGEPSNIGVIGFAAYREAATLASYRPPAGPGYGLESWDAPLMKGSGASRHSVLGTRSASSSALSSANVAQAAAGPALGTGIGKAEYNPVGRTTFLRAGEPDILEIGYDTEDNLAKMGVLGPPEPRAFPPALTGYERYETL